MIFSFSPKEKRGTPARRANIFWPTHFKQYWVLFIWTKDMRPQNNSLKKIFSSVWMPSLKTGRGKMQRVISKKNPKRPLASLLRTAWSEKPDPTTTNDLRSVSIWEKILSPKVKAAPNKKRSKALLVPPL